MQQYNAVKNKRDQLTCRGGCCRYRKHQNALACRRRAKKAARQESQKVIHEDVLLPESSP